MSSELFKNCVSISSLEVGNPHNFNDKRLACTITVAVTKRKLCHFPVKILKSGISLLTRQFSPDTRPWVALYSSLYLLLHQSSSLPKLK